MKFRRKTEPKVHDYRLQTRKWGHDCFGRESQNRKGERQLELTGFGSDVSKGDYLLLGSGKGGTWLVTAIEYQGKPADMWEATAIRQDVPSEKK